MYTRAQMERICELLPKPTKRVSPLEYREAEKENASIVSPTKKTASDVMQSLVINVADKIEPGFNVDDLFSGNYDDLSGDVI